MDIAVIGGGISGTIFSIVASTNNKVTILEGNKEILKKLLLTGNGRCNYFNDDQDVSKYNSSSNLDNIINKENIEKVKSFYDSIGLIPRIKNGYYYPYSNNAASVKEILIKELRNNKVKLITNYKVKSIKKVKDKFIINDDLKFDKVVISTGGKSYPSTGSDGSGYDLLKNLGLKIIDVKPALTSLYGEGNYFNKWSGVRCEARVSLYENDRFIKSEDGELQLTKYGLSGICIFNLSSYISRNINNNSEEIRINFIPFTDNPKEFLIDRNKKLKNRKMYELLEGIINYKLFDILIKKNKYLDEYSESELNEIVNNLSSFKVKIFKTNDFNNSQVSSGGLSLDEVNENFEVKKIPGLYVIGEVLDVDGLCGGYNITFSSLSAIKAGESLD